MSKGIKRFLVWFFVACVVAIALCAWYYIDHPSEADNGIVSTIAQIDNA